MPQMSFVMKTNTRIFQVENHLICLVHGNLPTEMLVLYRGWIATELDFADTLPKPTAHLTSSVNVHIAYVARIRSRYINLPHLRA
jgi:hypothetical protein